MPQDRVDHVVAYVPETCTRCRGPLPAEPQPGDPEPAWHQVAELPVLAAILTEHQAHARTCPQCGQLNHATIPGEVRAHTIGPRLAAVMSYLSGRHHRGKRGVQEIVQTVFEVPVSLGTVAALEQQTSAALTDAHDQARHAVGTAPVKNTDETGWSERGQKRWLWAAATATVAVFVIHVRRNFEGLKALLGETITGIVCSDRWAAYSKLPLHLRQICWAHLRRDFQKAAAFCANLLALEPALWTFAQVEGVEPTNNHAERLLRSGVLWRKNAFGCHSEAGCRFAERMLTVVQTLRLQRRPVLDYLYRALVAHRSGAPAPALLEG